MSFRKPLLAAALACALAAPAVAAAGPADAGGEGDPFAQGLAQARARRAPVLIDYHAPWCYSCYYMAKNVLTGAEWDRARRDTVVVELDADSPVGARYMQAWNVKAMPTYLLFDAEGRELGRILGEQTRADFYGWLRATVARANPLEALKAQVTDGSARSLDAAREVLRAHHARYDAAGGLAWEAALAAPVRAALAADAGVATWLARLRLQQASGAKDAAGCLEAAETVLAADLGCERPYELGRVLGCSVGHAELEPVRDELLRGQREPMRALLARRVLAVPRCADERSVVLATADLHEALGDAEGGKAALDRAIAGVKARIGDAGSGRALKKDRNLADNLRVYLDRAGRTGELHVLLEKLIATYPDDYVYAHRYAKSLAGLGRHEQALPYYAQAAGKAYGINRLRNAELHARSLQALDRKAEARTVLAEALKANGPWFPEEAARLKALMAGLAAT